MNENHVLVAYATRGGASAEAALKIADVLRSRGFEVEVVNFGISLPQTFPVTGTLSLVAE
jgi:flavodoxin